MWRYVKAAFTAGLVVAIITCFYLFSWVLIPLGIGGLVFVAILEDSRKKPP
ncbi:gp078 [Erwinia phage vB_EamP-S6]|uniref:Gp078 n=1 Tax=Erwinia phage vB_EamP-S6 TaxID=1051675 RepID=G0YQH0_9CAUD|nr:gp078 [Erwinia phage vB_EamP-S6]AEJ81597.1 gp078 [Erwinia phage vB_EamP-S6]